MLRFEQRGKVAELPIDLDRSGRDDFFNTPSIPQQTAKGIFINRHIPVQATAAATGYNIQYLRRMLRSGALKGVKIGQMWLIEMEALETYLKSREAASDRRCGPP